MKKRVVCGILAAYLCLWAMMGFLQNSSRKIPWQERYQVVCHALGRTAEGWFLTNSREAFLYNYSRGHRVFEVDVEITSDGVMVLRHDWNSGLGQEEVFGWTEEEKWAVTEEEFVSAPIFGQYTPLTLKDWFEIMRRYPDVYMVTDTKYSSQVEKEFQLFVDTAVKNGCEDVLSRVIVQLYYKEMYDEVRAVYPFQNMILTLYYIGYPDRESGGVAEMVDFMNENRIPVLVMPSDWWSEAMQKELRDSGIQVFVHTVNEEAEGKKKLTEGVRGIYTDDILPSVFSGWLSEMKK